MRFLGLIVALGTLALAMSLSSSLMHYINGPSVLLVCAVGLGTVLFSHGPKGLGLLLRALGSEVTRDEAEEAASVALSATKSFHCAGIMGFLIGSIAMLANLDDPAAIGPAVAVALLTVLYGFGASTLLWMPTERRMRALVAHGAIG
ncbi:MAG: MotA/TolQ/ExbB proton channel family protein [Myxococcota bacterium]